MLIVAGGNLLSPTLSDSPALDVYSNEKVFV